MKIDFSNKLVMVSAASKGIGFEAASQFYKSGAQIAVCSRDLAVLESKLKTLDPKMSSGRIFYMNGDIGDLVFLEKFVSGAVKHFEKSVDILVNNNGGPPAGLALEMTEEQWMGAIQRNLLSTIRLSRLVVGGMKEKKWGRIINLTSMTAKEPDLGMALSNVTRAGVAAFSKTLAAEVGPYGVTVNTILTGGVLTDRLHSLIQRSTLETKESVDQAMNRVIESIPVRHLATPEEFVQVILFLASSSSSYISGTAIPVDGGASKQIL